MKEGNSSELTEEAQNPDNSIILKNQIPELYILWEHFKLNQAKLLTTEVYGMYCKIKTFFLLFFYFLFFFHSLPFLFSNLGVVQLVPQFQAFSLLPHKLFSYISIVNKPLIPPDYLA